MPTKQIYFTEELYFRLREVENISGLIQNLLRDHFKKTEKKQDKNPISEIKENMNKLQEKKAEIEKKQKEAERIKKIEAPNFLKDWLKKQEKKPSLFACRDFVKAKNLNGLKFDAIKIRNLWDEVHNG